MPFRRLPVRRIHLRRCAWKLEAYTYVTGDAHRQLIQFRMTARSHAHRRAPQKKLALDYTAPQIELLVNPSNLLGVRNVQADSSQVQPMRVLPQPVEQLALLSGARVIADFASVNVKLFGSQRSGRRSRKTMPSPLRLRTQRHRLL